MSVPETDEDVKVCLKRINDDQNVQGLMIVTPDGKSIKPPINLNEKTIEKHAEAIAQLAGKARSIVRDINPQDDLEFLRMRSSRNEVLVAPASEFLLVALQDVKNIKKTQSHFIRSDLVSDNLARFLQYFLTARSRLVSNL